MLASISLNALVTLPTSSSDADLNDCESALNDFINNNENTIESAEERRKAKQLIELCSYIAENYSAEDIDDSEDEDEEEEEE